MGDIIEGPSRQLWKRIFGGGPKRQDPPRVSMAPPPVENTQETQRLADEVREQIKRATDIKPAAIPGNVDFEDAAVRLDQAVKAKQVYGKFPSEVRVKDLVIHHNNWDDFKTYGDTTEIPFRGGNPHVVHLSPLTLIQDILRSRPSTSPTEEEFNTLRKKHFVGAVNVPDSDDAIVSFMFLQDHRDQAGRAAGMAAINFKMPKVSASDLLGLIQKNPDFAETFLGKAAEGYEAISPNTDAGIKRIQSDEVVLLHLDRLDPDLFNQFIDQSNGTLQLDKQKRGFSQMYYIGPKIKNALLTGVAERLKYSTPHGIADPAVIE